MTRQRQHYISKHLIKRWAENGKVGVVCLYHRDSAVVPYTERTLHSVVNLWPEDLETSWSNTESNAAYTIDRLREALKSSDYLRAIENILSEPRDFNTLMDFAVLHHARSLAVFIQQMADMRNGTVRTDIEDMIRERWEAAQGYRDCGLVVSVLPSDAPLGLGAAPVFHTPHWNGPKLGSPTLFMMPLTPRLLIAGDSKMDVGQVKVVAAESEYEARFTLALAGEPDSMATPYLICKPSALVHTAQKVLDFTAGTPLHWEALKDRMRLHWESANAHQVSVWRRLDREQRNRQGWHDAPTTSNAMRKKYRQAMRADARALQEELDCLGVAMCDCDNRRDKESNPDIAALWEHVMPKAVCRQIRRNKNAASR